jgi:hypothetical protein
VDLVHLLLNRRRPSHRDQAAVHLNHPLLIHRHLSHRVPTLQHR